MYIITNLCTFPVSPVGSVKITPSGNIFPSLNSTVNLTCVAEGGPNNRFVWRRNGEIVSNNASLELTVITSSDGGMYECTVTNDAGSGTATTLVGMCCIQSW